MSDGPCFFCDAPGLGDGQIFMENDLFYARYDDLPVSPGHCEIVPKKHVSNFRSLNAEHRALLFDLVDMVLETLDKKFHPDAYNHGINDGRAAGRTVDHFHYHIIPRYDGDVPNPKGGVRNIIPGKGDYSDEMIRLGRQKYMKDL